ncbi:peptidoglycan DD-metalloendopeptidase family protein [Pseudoduganella sp. FT25W]|uniref:Peptidoglycan DD-metalloendopeptidase family protein n=1 Tax=Duganella alba TaxID=2666081 RepID=A0A6L5QNL8_9BURK|nr:M23/M56 family metallopeptidase [Duganella alba]MRX10521.1 peptidoglycan DD-metalloendopeptidase family protein [Duganella alba]MRX18141.1 peptidoglycan DD-metalloendopeptidase family protein [Duganella alba]
MAGAYLLAFQWLLACVGCVAAGIATWLLLNGAARLWPALRTRRAVWLAAQCVVATTAVLAFLPHSAQISLTPQIDLGPAVAAASQEADAADAVAAPRANEIAAARAVTRANAAPAAAPQATGHANSGSRALPLLAALWLLLYAAGLARAVTRQLRAHRLWRDLLASSRRLTPIELQGHSAFTASQLREIARHKLTVLRTDAAVSPMLIGIRRPHLLLPAHLDALSTTQQQMIIAHELHHWRVRDPLCLGIAASLQTLFWFNPALRWMARQMEWALELSCDQHVLAGRPQHQRKQYAASLLQQWTTRTPTGVAAFNGATIAARIRQMQKDGLPALSTAAAWLTAAALSAILAIGALLQPALAFSVPAPAAPTIAATPAATTVAETWRAPLDKVRVTSFFGVTRSILPTPHKGIDFAATKGTPVHATASGTVISAGPLAENDGRYGNAVIIDHGAQRSLYAHLNSVSVQPGQHVQAGQLIGAVGQSGFATGPHLHLEVRRSGQLVDPATMLTNLDAYATPRALKVRRQQLPSKG